MTTISIIMMAAAVAINGVADTVYLAGVAQGEAGICGRSGMMAIASVARNNSAFNAWERPTPQALSVAVWHVGGGDLFDGRGLFAFSLADVLKPTVQALVAGREELGNFYCRGGLGLKVYGEQNE